MDKLGLVFFPAFDWSISPTHPEREERLLYTRDQIIEEGLLDMPGIKEYKPSLAAKIDLGRVHLGIPDISELIANAHLVSAGGAITAADVVLQKKAKRAFALVRPPGHHAMRVVHGIRGFCTINNEAVMIEYLRRKYGIKKVAIVDTDVHHGDGTQDIFYHDQDTLFISIHQDGRTLYPGSGAIEELGSPNAYVSTVNLPMPPGTSDAGLHYVLDNLIIPMLQDFEPELIVNSAGQDNHYSDPLANMEITAQGYAKMAEKLKADIAVLEGGYSIEAALPYVNLGIILAMAEMSYAKVSEPEPYKTDKGNDRENAYMAKLVTAWQDIWRNRAELKASAIAKTDGVWRRQRRVYYDDSQIMEKQIEELYLCPRCSGYMTIKTQAEGGLGSKSAYSTVIFRDSCLNCRKKARDLAKIVRKRGEYGQYIIQDIFSDTLEY